MKSIGGFFDKFKNRAFQEIQNLDFTIEIIKKHTGIALEMKDFKIQSGILRVKASSLQKNEIFMKKSQILRDIKQKMPQTKVYDIQ